MVTVFNDQMRAIMSYDITWNRTLQNTIDYVKTNYIIIIMISVNTEITHNVKGLVISYHKYYLNEILQS